MMGAVASGSGTTSITVCAFAQSERRIFTNSCGWNRWLISGSCKANRALLRSQVPSLWMICIVVVLWARIVSGAEERIVREFAVRCGKTHESVLH